MIMNEAKARQIIKEELKQYLIEEGFFDTIKSFGKKVFGKDTTTQTNNKKDDMFEIPKEESKGKEQQLKSMADTFTKDANDMLNGYYSPINSEGDITKAIEAYSKLKPEEALTRMFKYLLRSMTKRQGNIVTQKEKQIYGVLIDDIEKQIANERKLKENETRKQVSSDKEKIEQLKKFMIPASLWGKTAIAFSDFIFDELIGNRNLSLTKLFKDINLSTAYGMLKDKLGYKFNINQNKKYTNTASKRPEEGFLEEIRRKRAKWTKMI
jgi:ribosomal 50S subunit-associated protein YjgA (DUF615 family)